MNSFYDARPGLGVETLAVALFAYLEWRGDMDEGESPVVRSSRGPVCGPRHTEGLGRRWRCRRSWYYLGGDIADAQDVDVAVLLGEPEF